MGQPAREAQHQASKISVTAKEAKDESDVYEDISTSAFAARLSADAFEYPSVRDLAMRSASARSRVARATSFRAAQEPL